MSALGDLQPGPVETSNDTIGLSLLVEEPDDQNQAGAKGPEAFDMLFAGAKNGKLLIEV